MDFCETSLSLLEEVTSQDKLYFKSNKTGTVYEGTPESTMLASEEVGEINSVLKFRNALNVTAYDPVNPRVRVTCPNPKCGRKIVSFQRLGDEKRVVFVCLCGHRW
jgi:DNA-directed RNA polymerase subunit M/transcription elongation factor TFIIS